MAYCMTSEKIVGIFEEKGFGHAFEYSMNPELVLHPDLKTHRNTVYPHKVWVKDGWRRALVKKTVAYIVVDETDDGYTIEKWDIKGNRKYSN